jgi:hypothetical protein
MPINKEFIEKVRAFLDIYPKSHSLNSLKNAYNLLDKARKYQGNDDSISLFCAITAVEEAVSSIFLALKHLGYDSADKINHFNHIHKSAFYPFCKALVFSFELFNNSKPQLAIDKNGKYPKLFIRFFVENFNGESFLATPEVPFGFTISNDVKIEDFENNLKNYFGEEYEGLEKWLKNEANLRNRILYATPNGIPKVEITDPEKYLNDYEQKINTIMLLYFLIAPYKEKQIFVQQALHAFVKMIGKIPNEAKLLEMIESIEPAPVECKINLNTGKIVGIQIDGSVIKEVEYKENEIKEQIGSGLEI